MKGYVTLTDDDIDLLHCDITNWINQIHEQRFSNNLSILS